MVPLIFTDPTCGDGVCDAPAEFPAYGRFGCAADCGSLLDSAPSRAASSLHASVFYNFTHSLVRRPMRVCARARRRRFQPATGVCNLLST